MKPLTRGNLDEILRCAREGCVVRATFGRRMEDLGPVYCSAHATTGMIDMRQPRCRAERCALHPAFGYPDNGSRVEYCNYHRLEGMIDFARPVKNATAKPQSTPKGMKQPITPIAGRKRGRSNGDVSSGRSRPSDEIVRSGQVVSGEPAIDVGERATIAPRPRATPPSKRARDREEHGGDSQRKSSAGDVRAEVGGIAREAIHSGGGTEGVHANGDDAAIAGGDNVGGAFAGASCSSCRGQSSRTKDEQARGNGVRERGGVFEQSTASATPASGLHRLPATGWVSPAAMAAGGRRKTGGPSMQSPLALARGSGRVTIPLMGGDGTTLAVGGGSRIEAGVGGGPWSVRLPDAAAVGGIAKSTRSKSLTATKRRKIGASERLVSVGCHLEGATVEQQEKDGNHTRKSSLDEEPTRDSRQCTHKPSPCRVYSCFGYPGGKREVCSAHKSEGMVNLNRRSQCLLGMEFRGGARRTNAKFGNSQPDEEGSGYACSNGTSSQGKASETQRRLSACQAGKRGQATAETGKRGESTGRGPSTVHATPARGRPYAGGKPANRSRALCRGEGETCILHASFGYLNGRGGKEYCFSHQLHGMVNLVNLLKIRRQTQALQEATARACSKRSSSGSSLAHNAPFEAAETSSGVDIFSGAAGAFTSPGTRRSSTASSVANKNRARVRKAVTRSSARRADAEGKPMSHRSTGRLVPVPGSTVTLSQLNPTRAKQIPSRRAAAAAETSARAGTSASSGGTNVSIARVGSDASHKTPCDGDGCGLTSRFGYLSKGKRLYCSAHKKPGMINLDQMAKLRKKKRKVVAARPAAIIAGRGKQNAMNAKKSLDVKKPHLNPKGKTPEKLTRAANRRGGKATLVRSKVQCVSASPTPARAKTRIISSNAKLKAPRIEKNIGGQSGSDTKRGRSKRTPGKETAEAATNRSMPEKSYKTCKEESCTLHSSFGFAGGVRQFCCGHKRPGMVNLAYASFKANELERRTTVGKEGNAIIIPTASKSTASTNDKKRSSNKINSRAKKMRPGTKTSFVASSNRLTRSPVVSRAGSSSSTSVTKTLCACRQNRGDSPHKDVPVNLPTDQAVGRSSHLTSGWTSRVAAKEQRRRVSASGGSRGVNAAAAAVKNPRANAVKHYRAGGGREGAGLSATAIGRTSAKRRRGDGDGGTDGCLAVKQTRRSSSASGGKISGKQGDSTRGCSDEGGERSERVYRRWQGAKCVVCGRLAKIGCTASSCFDCCVKADTDCEAHAKRLERKQREDELLAGPASQSAGGAVDRAVDDIARLPKGAFKEVSFHATGETATLWCFKDFICGKETRSAMETLHRTQRAGRLSLCRGEADALTRKTNTSNRSPPTRQTSSPGSLRTDTSDGPHHQPSKTNECLSAEGLGIRRSGSSSSTGTERGSGDSKRDRRGNGREAGADGPVNVENLAALRASAVGAKWRQKHAQLLLALE